MSDGVRTFTWKGTTPDGTRVEGVIEGTLEELMAIVHDRWSSKWPYLQVWSDNRLMIEMSIWDEDSTESTRKKWWRRKVARNTL